MTNPDASIVSGCQERNVDSSTRKKNAPHLEERQQSSPMNVGLAAVSVNSPPSPDQSLTSLSISSTIVNTDVIAGTTVNISGGRKDKMPKRNRRRRNGRNKGKSGSSSDGSGNKSCLSQQQQKKNLKESTGLYRTPIISWRNGSNNRRQKNNNNSNSGRRQHSQQHQRQYQQHQHQHQQQSYKHSNELVQSSVSSAYGNYGRNHHYRNQQHHSPATAGNYSSPRCAASMGFPTSKKQHDAPMKKRDLYFSLHVEKVGIDAQPREDEKDRQLPKKTAAARVTLLNWENEVVLDTFVIVPVPVTDFYDTGIRPEYLQLDEGSGDETPLSLPCIHSFADVRSKVENILKGKILIGYKLDESLQGLGLSHPNSDTRECSSYFSSILSVPNALLALDDISERMLNASVSSVILPPSTWSAVPTELKEKSSMMIDLSIDDGISRKPIQNCITVINLYKKFRQQWEEALTNESREKERNQQTHLTRIAKQRRHEQLQHQRQKEIMKSSIPTVSLHCDYVRTDPSGRTKTLARIVVADGFTKNILMDEYVQIAVHVTDFCNTGITSDDVKVVNDAGDCTAKPLQILRIQVERLLSGRILVGYKVEDDLKALGLFYPCAYVRDTAFFPPFLRERVVGGSRVVTVRTMDELSEEFLRCRMLPCGDRYRCQDLCRASLHLYEMFRDRWDQLQVEPYSLPRQYQSEFMPATSIQASNYSPHHSPHNQPHHQYTNGRADASLVDPQPNNFSMQSCTVATMLANSMPQKQQLQLSPNLPKSLHESNSCSRKNTSSSPSWFTWAKQNQNSQEHQNQGEPIACQMLSSQAFQLLQQAPSNDELQHRDNYSSSSYLDSSMYDDGEMTTDSRYASSFLSAEESHLDYADTISASASIVSSLREEVSNLSPNDQNINMPEPSPLKKNSALSSSPSWFRFGSRKSKSSSGASQSKKNYESMTAVQESEILNDDLIIPAVELFPVSHEKENVVGLDPIPDPERETEGPFSSTPPHIPTRSWLRFRRSSGSPSPRRKDRSRSPPSKSQSSDVNVDDQTATARPEVSRNATEAIEVTISIPSPLDSTEDSISPLAEKSTMNARSSSSWFNFRRSLKSSGSCKNLGSSPCLSAKSPDFPNRESIPSLVPSTTEKTAGTDDEWLQEVMSLSTAGGDVGDLSPWLPESGQKEMKGEKSSNSSRLFSFKWTKPSNSVNKVEEININDILDNPVGNSWATESNSSFLWNNSGDANEFHNRHRLSTESTIQSVVTEVHEEEELADGSDFAQQSFNFLKI